MRYAPWLSSFLARFGQPRATFCPTQTRLSILCWSPGPKRWDLDVTEHHTVVRWHIVSLLETPELLQHVDITQQFHVAHFRRCASTLVNLTLASSQIFKLADVACFVGWAFEAVGSRLRFRCLRNPRNCKSSCIVVSLHCQNAVAEKRSIALNVLLAVRTAMVQDDADIVAADLKGASWQRKEGTDQRFDRIREVAFKKTQGFLCHLALHFRL